MAGEAAAGRQVKVESWESLGNKPAQPFAASSWLGVGSDDKQVTRARASLPWLLLRMRMALPNSASPRSQRDEEMERACFVYGSDAPSAVPGRLGKLPVAWSGRESGCHVQEELLGRKRSKFALQNGAAVTTSPSTTGRCRISPNENKMSNRYRERARFEVKMP